MGLGYVGSVASAGLAKAGHDVIGVDIDLDKVSTYREGIVPIYEPGLSEMIHDAFDRGSLRFLHTDEVSEPLGEVIVVATGTPMAETGAADLRQVRSALAWIIDKQSGGGIIVMKSTVPPGTGVRLKKTVLHDARFRYVSNPEFLREGQAVQDWFHPDRIVIGATDDDSSRATQALYQGIEAPYFLTDVTSAEMIKYASNAFLATKISFVNEIAALCDRFGATIDEVAEGIALDPRIGPSSLRPGVGYGGSCFPKDVRALDQLALTNGHNFELLRSVITVNNRQRLLPLYTLRERFGSLVGLSVGILGLAFKPNTDDIREAPSLDLIHNLVDDGAQVSAYDPMALPGARRALPATVRLAKDPLECANGAQALVLMTEWPEIVEADWEKIATVVRAPRMVFDGRNALDPREMQGYGFEYVGVGRRARLTAEDGVAAQMQAR